MTRHRWLTATGTVAIFGFIVAGAAQERFVPRGPELPPPLYLNVDDQLFDVSGITDGGGPARNRPQGVTLDSDSVTGNLKFGGWEGGVIPIEFAAIRAVRQARASSRGARGSARPDVSPETRDAVMRAETSEQGSACRTRTLATPSDPFKPTLSKL